MKGFEEVEHTADWAFRARGSDLKQVFANAASAMFELQARQPLPPAETVERELEVRGFDRETLLVNWLNELLYLQEKYGEIYRKFDVQEISDTQLRARVRGQPSPGVARMIKAVTFHGLEVRRVDEGWEVTVVLDV
jgi:SHS2 domain-containing protein